MPAPAVEEKPALPACLIPWASKKKDWDYISEQLVLFCIRNPAVHTAVRQGFLCADDRHAFRESHEQPDRHRPALQVSPQYVSDSPLYSQNSGGHYDAAIIDGAYVPEIPVRIVLPLAQAISGHHHGPDLPEWQDNRHAVQFPEQFESFAHDIVCCHIGNISVSRTWSAFLLC